MVPVDPAELTTDRCIDAVKSERAMSTHEAVDYAIAQIEGQRERLESGEEAADKLRALLNEVEASLRAKETADLSGDPKRLELKNRLLELRRELEEKNKGALTKSGEWVGKQLDSTWKSITTIFKNEADTFGKEPVKKVLMYSGAIFLTWLVYKGWKKLKDASHWTVGAVTAAVLAVGAAVGMNWCARKIEEMKAAKKEVPKEMEVGAYDATYAPHHEVKEGAEKAGTEILISLTKGGEKRKYRLLCNGIKNKGTDKEERFEKKNISSSVERMEEVDMGAGGKHLIIDVDTRRDPTMGLIAGFGSIFGRDWYYKTRISIPQVSLEKYFESVWTGTSGGVKEVTINDLSGVKIDPPLPGWLVDPSLTFELVVD